VRRPRLSPWPCPRVVGGLIPSIGPCRPSAAAAARFRQLASEVLCSDAWAITETTLASPDDFLRPFWDAILGPPPADATTTSDSPDGTAAAREPVSGTAGAESAQGDRSIAERRMSSDDSSSTDVDLTDDSAEEKPMDLEDEPPAAAPSATPAAASEPAEAEGWHPAVVAKSGTAGDESSEDEFEEVDASDRPREEPSELDLVDSEREVIHGQWNRINSHLLGKKTAEVRLGRWRRPISLPLLTSLGL